MAESDPGKCAEALLNNRRSECGGNRFSLVSAQEVIPVDCDSNLEPGITAHMPGDSKDLPEAAQPDVTNRREERDHVLDPLARLDLIRRFEQNARRTDIHRFRITLYRQAANLSDQYWQSQSVSLCTSLIQASNLRDGHPDGNG
jgi:hypothetical protein